MEKRDSYITQVVLIKAPENSRSPMRVRLTTRRGEMKGLVPFVNPNLARQSFRGSTREVKGKEEKHSISMSRRNMGLLQASLCKSQGNQPVTSKIVRWQ